MRRRASSFSCAAAQQLRRGARAPRRSAAARARPTGGRAACSAPRRRSGSRAAAAARGGGRAAARRSASGRLPLGRELVEAPHHGLDRLAPARELLRLPRRWRSARPSSAEAEPADHARHQQALADQRHHDHAEGEEQDQIAMRERLAARGGERNRERGRQRHDAADAGEADQERRLPGGRRDRARASAGNSQRGR